MYKKEVLNLKKKLIIIFVLFMFVMALYSFKESFCELAPYDEYIGTKIPITVTLSGTPSDSETVFKYEIKPEPSNIPGAADEPTEVTVVVSKDDERDLDGRITKTAYVDFTNTQYFDPAVYKYTISEIYCSNEKEYPISSQKYKFSVEVIEQADGTLKQELYKYAFDLNNNTKEDKLTFSHDQMTYLTLKLTTTGRRANSDEYFKLTLSIFGREGDIYSIIGQDNIVTYNNQEIETLDSFEIVDGNYSFNIYLKDNQVAYIGSKTENGQVYYQIPVGTYISVVENDARKYQTFINEEEGKIVVNFVLTNDEEENAFDIVNHRDYDVAITGVFIDILTYIIIAIIVLAGLGYMVYKRTKDKKDDEDN